MSVSYVVPVWREEVYATVCLPWIRKQVEWFDAQLVEVRNSKSIFEAMERGRREAKHRHIVYVHDDVRLLRPAELTPQIVRAFSSMRNVGLFGAVGKVRKEIVPWWLNPGPYVGHYCRRGTFGELIYQYATASGSSTHRELTVAPAQDNSEPRWNRFARAGLVDGFFLAEDRDRLVDPWDTHTYGDEWHGYDMDRCFQTHALGLDVFVGHWLFLHDNAGHVGYKGTERRTFNRIERIGRKKVKSHGDRLWLADLEKVNVMLRRKWGLQR